MYDFKIEVSRRPFLFSIALCFAMEILVGFSDDLITALLRFSACCIFSYCIYRGMQEKFLLNPYLLFSITPLSLLMYTENLSTYYLDALTSETWLLCIINMIAFVIALNITKGGRDKDLRENSCYMSESEEDDIDDEEVYNPNEGLHAIILCLLGVSPVITSVMGFLLPFRSIITFFSYIGVTMAFKTKKKYLIIICLLMSLLNFIDDFNKTSMLFLTMTVLISFEVYYINNVRDRVKFFCIAGAAGVLMLIIAFPLKAFFREGGSYIDFIFNFPEISASAFSFFDDRITFDGFSFLSMPYMYLIQGWNNVQYVLETQNTRTYGLWLLKPLLGYLQIDGFFESFYELEPASSFNTFTYISVLFKDFGYWGSIIGSSFLGFYVKRIYIKLRKGCSAFDAAAYALVGMATLEMFFSNHFFSLSYPFTVVIIGFYIKKVFSLK